MTFFSLGEKKAKEIILLLFIMGIIPIAYYCIMFGSITAATYPQQITVPSQYGGFTGTTESNGLLGFFVGVVSFVVAVVVWKLLCELLLLVFRCLEVYISKNSIDE